MEHEDFFREIEHRSVPWGDRSMLVPVFYQQVMSLGAMFLASWEKLRALLPSPRMYPFRVTPGQGILYLAGLEYGESDIGPYNEFSIMVPMTLDKPSPMFTGILRKAPEEPNVYIHHLPVTTDIAMASGIEFAGYPKFLATIEFEHEGDWVRCRLEEDGRHILTLSGRKLPLQRAPRYRARLFTTRNRRLLRSDMVHSERGLGESRDSSHVRLELGDHPIAQELKNLNIGRLSAYQYAPDYQMILSPVIESFAF
jgi:hypothetical protein